MTNHQSTNQPITNLYPEHLHIGVYRVTLVALEPVELSDFSAATLRGAFGWSFKRMVCYQPQVKTCRGCLLRGQCPYPQVFEPPPPPDSIYAGQQQTVPPYVLRRPLTASLASTSPSTNSGQGSASNVANGPQTYAPGDSFAFEIVLAGWANGMIPYFALALQQLEAQGVGRGRGAVQVVAVDLLPPGVSGQLDSGQISPSLLAGKGPGDGVLRLFDANEPDQIASHGGFPASDWITDMPAPSQLTVNFISPTRLQSEGRVQGEPDFHVFYRALLRRLSALATVHTDTPWETDFAGLANAARAIETVASSMKLERRQRRSDRQGKMEFWGAEGIMVYRGDFTPFWRLLQLGQVLHVGKNCTFGLGRYVVV